MGVDVRNFTEKYKKLNYFHIIGKNTPNQNYTYSYIAKGSQGRPSSSNRMQNIIKTTNRQGMQEGDRWEI